jgi:hypothetical protein
MPWRPQEVAERSGRSTVEVFQELSGPSSRAGPPVQDDVVTFVGDYIVEMTGDAR